MATTNVNLSTQTLQQFNEWRATQGLPPLSGGGRRTPRAVRLSDEAYDNLRKMALHYGYQTNRGRGPDDPTRYAQGAGLSDFLEALGGGLYIVSENTQSDLR